MDIEKCYDSVGVTKLKELLHKTELLEKDYYLLTALVLKRKNNVVVDDKEKGDVVKQTFKTHFRHKF